ncbi:MAG: VWA domain-containing protein [Singulisphaera sp.]
MSSGRQRVDDHSECLNPGVQGMYFANPECLWLLAVLAPLAGWIARGRRRRLRDWDALGQSGRPRGDGSLGWLGATVLLVVATAQPRWGRVQGPPSPPGHDVALLVDVSRSMGAEDAVPNRLGVAVEAARSLVAAWAAGEIGLRWWRSPAEAWPLPLTENLGRRFALQELRPGDVRPGGTDLGAALGAALEAFDDQEHEEGRTIVLFSDGEDHGRNWEPNVIRLRQARVIVHSIAIGDREAGHPVPSGRDTEFLTYGGAPVLSRRSDHRFQDLAKATGGVVVPLGLATVDLGVLYDTRIARAERRQRAATRSLERAERYPLFVLAALVFGLAGSSPLVGRRGWPRLLGIVVSVAAVGAGKGDEPAAVSVASGREAYASRRFLEASPPSSGRSLRTPAGRSHAMMRPRPCTSSGDTPRPSSAIARPECVPSAACVPRSTTRWGTPPSPWAMSPRRFVTTTPAWPRPCAVPPSMPSGATPRSTVGSPSNRSPSLDPTRWRRRRTPVASPQAGTGSGRRDVPGTLRSEGRPPGGRFPIRRLPGRRGAGGAGGRDHPPSTGLARGPARGCRSPCARAGGGDSPT